MFDLSKPFPLSSILGFAIMIGTAVQHAFPGSVYGQLAGAAVAVLLNERTPAPPAG